MQDAERKKAFEEKMAVKEAAEKVESRRMLTFADWLHDSLFSAVTLVIAIAVAVVVLLLPPLPLLPIIITTKKNHSSNNNCLINNC